MLECESWRDISHRQRSSSELTQHSPKCCPGLFDGFVKRLGVMRSLVCWSLHIRLLRNDCVSRQTYSSVLAFSYGCFFLSDYSLTLPVSQAGDCRTMAPVCLATMSGDDVVPWCQSSSSWIRNGGVALARSAFHKAKQSTESNAAVICMYATFSGWLKWWWSSDRNRRLSRSKWECISVGQNQSCKGTAVSE